MEAVGLLFPDQETDDESRDGKRFVAVIPTYHHYKATELPDPPYAQIVMTEELYTL